MSSLATFETPSVADPGFPRGGGANSPGGGANIRFCQIFPKTAWNWKNLDPQGGRASKILLCRSATDHEQWIVPMLTNFLSSCTKADILPMVAVRHTLDRFDSLFYPPFEWKITVVDLVILVRERAKKHKLLPASFGCHHYFAWNSRPFPWIRHRVVCELLN